MLFQHLLDNKKKLLPKWNFYILISDTKTSILRKRFIVMIGFHIFITEIIPIVLLPLVPTTKAASSFRMDERYKPYSFYYY